MLRPSLRRNLAVRFAIPSVLGGLMIAFGIAVLLMGISNNEKIKGDTSWRALIVLPIATAVFGVVMEHVGFIPAMLLLIPMSAASGSQFKWGEVILLTIGLTIICTGVFIYGLGLPYPLIKGYWG